MAILTPYWILDLLLIILIPISLLYLHFKLWGCKHWARRKIPYEEPYFLTGNTKDANIKISLGQLLDKLYEKHKGKKIVGMWAYIRPNILVLDVELIKQILIKDFSHFHDRGLTINEELEPLTAHLFNMSGQKWRNMRVKLTPTFTSGKMKMMYDTMYDVGSKLQKYLDEKEGHVLEVKDVLARFTTDVISSCAFGIESNALENPQSEFRKYGKMVSEPPPTIMITAIIQFVAPWLMKFIPLRQLSKEVSDFFMKVVKDVIKFREETNSKRNDFMQLLIELKNKGFIDDVDNKEAELGDEGLGDPFTIEQAAAQAFVFFFAGFETSSTTMMLTLYELARHPDIQEKLQREIDEALVKASGKISYNSIMSLEYLEQVVQESLRKYPAVPVLFRECTKDYQVPDSDIKFIKGDFLLIPISAIQNDEEFFPNPTRFDPERFSPQGKASRDSFLQLAFGNGPRICIGARFGTLQTKVGLVMILSKFNVEVCEDTPTPIVWDPKMFIPCPKNGMPLKFTRRVIKENQ